MSCYGFIRPGNDKEERSKSVWKGKPLKLREKGKRKKRLVRELFVKQQKERLL